MASIICTTCKKFIAATHYPYSYTDLDSIHVFAIIAKGNIIEGIKAKA